MFGFPEPLPLPHTHALGSLKPSKSVLLCDVPFLEGLESDMHNADVPDDLLACTPQLNSWGVDSPPDSPRHSSFDALSGAVCEPMLGSGLHSPFDDHSGSLVFDHWNAPESEGASSADPMSGDLGFGFQGLGTFGDDEVVELDDVEVDELDELEESSDFDTDDDTPRRVVKDEAKSSKRKAGSVPDVREKKRTKDKHEAARVARTEACEEAVKALAQSKNDEDPESKRHTHNVLERKRRNDLKNSYQLLRERVPSLEDDDRAPTGKILLHAVEFIQHLKKSESILDIEIARSRTENDRLRRLAGL